MSLTSLLRNTKLTPFIPLNALALLQTPEKLSAKQTASNCIIPNPIAPQWLGTAIDLWVQAWIARSLPHLVQGGHIGNYCDIGAALLDIKSPQRDPTWLDLVSEADDVFHRWIEGGPILDSDVDKACLLLALGEMAYRNGGDESLLASRSSGISSVYDPSGLNERMARHVDG